MKKIALVFTLIAIASCGYNVNKRVSGDNHSSEEYTYEIIVDTTGVGKISYPYFKGYPSDMVDLNDIFGSEDDPTDWNYTEIDEDDWNYLKKIGIYWDEEFGCFRKQK